MLYRQYSSHVTAVTYYVVKSVLFPSHTPAECLDHALNVLSRGLEKNKNSAELWENYLTLFASHPDKQELGEMCQTALQLAPSNAIWWKVCALMDQERQLAFSFNIMGERDFI